MGAVFEAEQLDTGRLIALKLLNHQLDFPEARARFLREGRLAASINHPNSVYVFGTEEIGEMPAISMKLVGGGTLEEIVKERGALPIGEADRRGDGFCRGQVCGDGRLSELIISPRRNASI
ncbi:MAG: hypothetical protein ACKVJU_02005 [Verrucomicrobiales bacterium]